MCSDYKSSRTESRNYVPAFLLMKHLTGFGDEAKLEDGLGLVGWRLALKYQELTMANGRVSFVRGCDTLA